MDAASPKDFRNQKNGLCPLASCRVHRWDWKGPAAAQFGEHGCPCMLARASGGIHAYPGDLTAGTSTSPTRDLECWFQITERADYSLPCLLTFSFLLVLGWMKWPKGCKGCCALTLPPEGQCGLSVWNAPDSHSVQTSSRLQNSLESLDPRLPKRGSCWPCRIARVSMKAQTWCRHQPRCPANVLLPTIHLYSVQNVTGRSFISTLISEGAQLFFKSPHSCYNLGIITWLDPKFQWSGWNLEVICSNTCSFNKSLRSSSVCETLRMSQQTSHSPALKKWHDPWEAFRLAPKKHLFLLWWGSGTDGPGPLASTEGRWWWLNRLYALASSSPPRCSGRDLQNPHPPAASCSPDPLRPSSRQFPFLASNFQTLRTDSHHSSWDNFTYFV